MSDKPVKSGTEFVTKRGQTVLNTAAGSIVSDENTGNEKIQITHKGGGNINLNDKVNSEFAPNNKQTLVHGDQYSTTAGDNFSTTKSNKEERVEGDLTIITGSEKFFTDPVASDWIDKSAEIAAAKAAPEYNYGAIGNNTGTEYANGGTPDSDSGAVEGGNYEPSPAHADIPALMEAKAGEIADVERQMGVGGNIKMMSAKHMFLQAGTKAVTFDSGVMVPNARKVVKQYEVDGGECKAVYTAVPNYESKDTAGSVPFGDVHVSAANKLRVVTGSGGVSVKSAGEVNINSTGRLILGGAEVAIGGGDSNNAGRITVVADHDLFQEAGVIATRVAPNINDVASEQHSFNTPKAVFTGDLHIKGNVIVEGGTGISVPAGDVVANVSLNTHTHGGVCAGSSNTSAPNGSGGAASSGGGGGGGSSFSGDYNDLTNKPSLFSGSYNDLTDVPATSNFSGSYNDLTDVPTTFNTVSSFSGSYNDLTDTPSPGLDSVAVLAAVAGAGYTTCDGDITNVSTGPYLTGGGASGSVEVGIDSACTVKWDSAAGGGIATVSAGTGLSGGGSGGGGGATVDLGVDAALVTYLDQSACPGLNCVGTVTSVGALIGATGSIEVGGTATDPLLSVSDACDTEWSGTATTVRANSASWDLPSDNITGDGTNNHIAAFSSDHTLIDSKLRQTFTDVIAGAALSATGGIKSGGQILSGGVDLFSIFCDEAGNSGDITSICASTLLSGGALAGDAEIGINSGALDYLNQSACPGLDCVGDITSVAGVAGLSGTALAGAVTLGIDSGTLTPFDQSACPGIDCVGTQTGLNVAAGIVSTGGTNPTICVDSACNTKWDQSSCAGLDCVGDITAVFTSAGLSGTAFAGDVTVGIDSGTLTPLDQSACPGLDCVGTVVASDLTNLDQSACPGLNKVGTVTGSTAGALLSTNNNSSCTEFGINAGALDYLNQSACPGIDCVGDITEVTTTGDYLTGGGLTGAINIGLDAGCAQKWDNASAGSVVAVTATAPLSSTNGTSPGISLDTACTSNWNTAYTDSQNTKTCPGLDKVGDITSVCGTAGLSGFAADGAATIGIAAGTLTPFDQSACPGLDCVGDITGVSTVAGLSGGVFAGTATIGIDSGTLTPFDQSACPGLDCVGTVVASDLTNLDQSSCAGLNCVGTVTGSTAGALLSTNDNGTCTTFGINAGALDYLNQSTCAGLDCVGDITEVTTTGDYLTGGGLTGAINIGLDAGCAQKWDNASAGSVVAVTATAPLSSTNGTSPGISLDTACTSNWNTAYTDSQNTKTCLGLDCVGDITGVFTSAGLSGTAFAGDVTIGIDSGTLTGLDQSACPGIDCVGDITSVCGTAGLSGFAADGAATIGIDSGTLTPFDQSACPGLDCVGTLVASDIASLTDCVGTVTGSTAGALLSTNDSGTCTTFGINAGALDYLNQSACAGLDCVGTVIASDLTGLDQSACAGLDCVGDITGVFTSAGLSGTAFAGDVTLGIDSGTLTPFDQSSCPGLDCVGTVTGSTAGALLSTNNSGSCTQFGINAGALDYLNQSACAGLDCVGTVVASDLTNLDQSACPGLDCVGDITSISGIAGLSGSTLAGAATIGIDSGTLTPFDQSACPGLDCVGDITSVCGTAGLSGFAADGAATIGIDSGTLTPFDQSACPGLDCVGTVVASDLTGLDQSGCAGLDCVGTITGITISDGLGNSGTATAPNIAVDSTVVRTTGNFTVAGDIDFTGNILSAGTDLDQLFGSGGGGIGEAPSDSNYYGRRNAGWAVMGGALCEGTVGGTGTNNYIPAWCSSTGLTDSKLRQTFTQVIAGATLSATGGLHTAGQILSAGQDLHSLLGGGGGSGGQVDSVTAGTAITIGGTAVDPTVSVTSACDTAWNAKTTCTGTVTCVDAESSAAGVYLSGGGNNIASIGIKSTCVARWEPPALFNVLDDGATGKLTTGTFADIDTIWDTPSVLDTSGYSWNSSTGALTVLKTGNLMITLKVVTWNDLNNRHQLIIRINKNGTYMVGDSQYASRNNTQDEGGAYIPNFMMPVAANDVITFQARDVGVAATMGGSTQVSKMTYASAILYPS